MARLLNAQGSAELTFQAYQDENTGISLQPEVNAGLTFSDLVPSLGLLSGSLDGGAYDSSLRRGRSYLAATDVSLGGGKIAVTVGDLSLAGALMFRQPSGLFEPEVSASGVQITFALRGQRYTVFDGSGFLLEGARIPYRFGSGQSLAGALSTWQIQPGLQLGARLTRIGSGNKAAEGPLTGPLTRTFGTTDTAAVDATWNPLPSASFFSEGGWSSSRMLPGVIQPPAKPFSGRGGGVFRFTRLVLKISAVSEAANYLPIVGYFENGRKELLADFRYRLFEKLQLFGSTSMVQYLADAAPLEMFTRSRSATAGFQDSFGSTSVSGNYSFLSSSFLDGALGAERFRNQSFNLTLGRQFGRHSLRASETVLSILSGAGEQKQTTAELEDGVHFRGATIGGALRFQRGQQDSGQSSIDERAFWNWGWHRISTFGSVDEGSDLPTRGLMTLSGTATSTVGLQYQISRQWELKGDGFRSRFLLRTSPDNASVPTDQFIPPDAVLRTNHWTTYAALTRTISWKGGESLSHVADLAGEQLPQTGTVAGMIFVTHNGRVVPAGAGITLSLDNGRIALTGSDGSYRFTKAGEGVHILCLDLSHLPADFDPPKQPAITISVVPGRLTRADFTVQHLLDFSGHVRALAGAHPENIVIHLDSMAVYTTTDGAGFFTFTNVAEGQHRVFVEPQSLPPDSKLEGSSDVMILVQDGMDMSLDFQLRYEPVVVPVRSIILPSVDQPQKR